MKMKRTRDIDRLIDQSGLRVRLFIYNIKGQGRQFRNLDNLLNDYFVQSVALDVNFFNESNEEVIEQLKNSKFMGYASIIIIVYRQPIAVWRPGFNKVLKAIECNRYLRQKSKLLLTFYPIDGKDDTESVVLNSYFTYLENDGRIAKLDDFLYPKKIERKKVKQIDADINRFCAARDYEEFNAFQLENTLMIQTFVTDKCNKAYSIDELFNAVFWNPFQSMQELLTQNVPFDLRRRIVKSTTNTDLYFYAINPALAIIINNYYFTNSLHMTRSGSDSDAAHLIRVLKLANIPFILVEDCERQEMLEILDYVATKDFHPLKTLLLCLMSHGDENNVFYTFDGELDIYADVVDRLQSNPSLTETKKIVLVNACRGCIDLENDIDEITDSPTTSAEKHPNLMENTIVLHGVPAGIQSPRSPLWGSPFIQSFCHHFLNINSKDDVRLLNERINSDLSKLDYFYGLSKCSDLALKDPKQSCTFLEKPINGLLMIKLIESIEKDFPNCKTPKNRNMISRFLYICGILNIDKLPEGDATKKKYFAPELEYEQCEVESHPSKIFGENV